MEFKVNLALFKSTEDSLKARYKEKYDPSKKYPQYSGNMQVTQMDIVKMVNYLQKAKPEATDYNPEGVVTIRAVGYINTSKNGLQYLSINLERNKIFFFIYSSWSSRIRCSYSTTRHFCFFYSL